MDTKYSNTLVSARQDKKLANTDDLYDKPLGKHQELINNENVEQFKSVEANLDKLNKEVFPLSVSCDFSPTALQEKGTTANVTIQNFVAKVSGQAVAITEKKINNVVITAASFSEKVSDTKSYTIAITAEGRTNTSSKTITFVYPIYVGFNSATAASSSLIAVIHKQALRSSLGSLSVTESNTSTSNYFWICSPFKVSKVTTSGIDIFGDFVQSSLSYSGTTYYCYRLSKASAISSFTFIIS